MKVPYDKKTDGILKLYDFLQWQDYKCDNIHSTPHHRQPFTHAHTASETSAAPKCNFHANFKHTYKKIPIFSVIVTQTLCFLCLTFRIIYAYFYPFLSLSVSSSCADLMQLLCTDQNARAQGCFTLLFLLLYLFM